MFLKLLPKAFFYFLDSRLGISKDCVDVRMRDYCLMVTELLFVVMKVL